MSPQSSRLSCRRPAGWSAYANAAQWDGPVAGESTTGVYLAHPSRDCLDAMGVSRSGTPRPPHRRTSFIVLSECPGVDSSLPTLILHWILLDLEQRVTKQAWLFGRRGQFGRRLQYSGAYASAIFPRTSKHLPSFCLSCPAPFAPDKNRLASPFSGVLNSGVVFMHQHRAD
jgi:hypothetical protein